MNLNRLGYLRAPLSRKEWVYLLSLLVPFVAYNLALKASNVTSVPGLALTFDLMRSDVFFNLGYALFWIGLFAVVPDSKRPLRRVVVFLFHLSTILVVVVTTSAHQYLQETGSTLDYGIIALWLLDLDKVVPVLTGSVQVWTWVILFAALFYTALGPLLVTHAIGRWRGWRTQRSQGGRSKISFLGSLGLLLLALGFGTLSLLIGARPTDFTAGASVSFVRDPFVNLIMTGIKEVSTDQEETVTNATTTAGQAVEHPAAHASLAQTSRTEKRNVVLIHLESTRAGAVSPYNSDLKTTPFLNELANSSLLAESYYTIIPHTSKASVSVNCGIEPHLVQPTTEAGTNGIPVPCLASLLKEQGYSTAFFQSSTKDFEDFSGLVKNFGYEDYYPLESMDTEGFKQSNYFGYEDDIMLKPSEQWLKEHKDKPFLAEYLMGTGHHDYQCLGLRYGDQSFSEDDSINRYLNCIRNQDFFLRNIFDQYEKLGLYDKTIFVLYGDHGEGFGEHGRYQHDDTIWEEGLKVPLIIHAPGVLDGVERVKGPSNHTDILPTVLDLLGYEVKNGEYPGYSLLRPSPEDRTLMFSCFHEEQCLARIKGSEKYIYHYGNQPDEIFDLSQDPLEKQNLASLYSEEALDKRRKELLEWRSKVNAQY
jgi:phosphoglycerol transferase MdoB-like AlkP superfamily enzyme